MSIDQILGRFERDRSIKKRLEFIQKNTLKPGNEDLRMRLFIELLYLAGFVEEETPKTSLSAESIDPFYERIDSYIGQYTKVHLAHDTYPRLYWVHSQIVEGAISNATVQAVKESAESFIKGESLQKEGQDPWVQFAKSFAASPYAKPFSDDDISAQLRSILKEFPAPAMPQAVLRANMVQSLEELIECASLELPTVTVVGRISNGSSKRVYVGVRTIDLESAKEGEPLEYICVKVFHPTKKKLGIMELKAQTLQDLTLNELRVRIEKVFAINNFNINGVIDGFRAENGLVVLYEPYCNGGSLLDYDKNLRNGRSIGYQTAIDYFSQIYNGCTGLMELGVMPNDLKFQNILVNIYKGKEQLRITDFEDIHPIGEKGEEKREQMNLGYPILMAPELLCTSEKPTQESLWWTLGAMFYQMLTGETLVPFKEPKGWADMPIEQRLRDYDSKIKQALYDLGQEGIDQKIGKVSGPAQLILQSTLNLDPSMRSLGYLMRDIKFK